MATEDDGRSMAGSMDSMQCIYVLRLVPRLLDAANWTPEDNAVVEEHFRHLEELLRDGTLILAGKTAGLDENTFGIVILAVEDEGQALRLMKNDPAVRKGVMTAELLPFNLALIRK